MFETYIEALCEHLRRMGLNATVESMIPKKTGDLLSDIMGSIMGYVRVVNRNIDLVELEYWYADGEYYFRCSYVVQAKVNGLEDRLKAKGKPVRKSFLSRQAVDFKWKGKELAQVLNGDANLRDMLCRMDIPRYLNPYLAIKPDTIHRCVRIRPILPSDFTALKNVFPTVEAFEAYDRIAQHIRSITG